MAALALAVFNLILIGVATGAMVIAQGTPGATGPRGEKGDTGDKGNTGDTGEKGDKGDTGDTGEKGDSYFTNILNDIKYSLGKIFVANDLTGQQTTIANNYVSVSPPSASGLVTIFNGINALIKHTIISVGYLNPITDVYKLLSGIGVETSSINPFGFLYFRCLNSSSIDYDSRIYESGSGNVLNGQGTMVLDSKNVETTGFFKSKYYNDNSSTFAPETMIGNNTEYIKFRYENMFPLQGGHIILKSNYAITLEAPYININGTLNRNMTAPEGIEDFFTNNADENFEITNPFNQMWF